MAVNVKVDKSFARGEIEKWPGHLETVEELCRPLGQSCLLFFYIYIYIYIYV